MNNAPIVVTTYDASQIFSKLLIRTLAELLLKAFYKHPVGFAYRKSTHILKLGATKSTISGTWVSVPIEIEGFLVTMIKGSSITVKAYSADQSSSPASNQYSMEYFQVLKFGDYRFRTCWLHSSNLRRSCQFEACSEGYQIGGAICDEATGATAKRLKLPREDEFWSRGISACAICDGASPIFKGEVLAVVGGGDTGTEEAIYLTKYARHAHLLVHIDQLKASRAMQDRVFDNPNITVHFNTETVDVDALVKDGLLDKLKIGPLETVKGGSIDPKGALLDFFGFHEEADDVLSRVEELQLLEKRLNCYNDPISQFQALMYLKPAIHIRCWCQACWQYSVEYPLSSILDSDVT
ncbi:unnamed protein product [Lactuca saligna]|uniref:FAD/NAD(P)-binding domain-containing protein n=1 Tax=Lactuca saligna TaxID=75948 RepID=A0AA36EMB9_LACSI|nr:unnamed protein product [Lactuca saligna]